MLQKLFFSLIRILVFIVFYSCNNNSIAQTTNTIRDIDGNLYHTVTIGIVTFTVENAQMTHYRNGDIIRNLKTNTDWQNAKTTKDSGAWCYYENTTNVDSQKNYGKLYNWYAVKDVRGLAPKGWHVATNKDFDKLKVNLTINIEGQEIKSAYYWKEDNADSTKSNRNSTRFTALPAGYRYRGVFFSMGSNSSFWSSTEDDSNDAAYHYLNSNFSGIYKNTAHKLDGLSVRFVKD